MNQKLICLEMSYKNNKKDLVQIIQTMHILYLRI